MAPNIKHIVDNFLSSNRHKDVAALCASLHAINKVGQTQLIQQVLGAIVGRAFYRDIVDALGTGIKDHPFESAVFLIGILVSVLGLALAGGFKTLLSMSGGFAVTLVGQWMASEGGIDAAKSALVLIQGWKIHLPVVAVSHEIGKWASGQYGTPVQNWARGDYGHPAERIAKWWNGEYGDPVASWWGSIFK